MKVHENIKALHITGRASRIGINGDRKREYLGTNLYILEPECYEDVEKIGCNSSEVINPETNTHVAWVTVEDGYAYAGNVPLYKL